MRRPCKLRVERVGRVSYGPMLTIQETRHAQVLAQQSDDTLFLLQHDPVITLGKNSHHENVLFSPDALAQRGVEYFETGRGGDVTYHGPGQIVGYPIVQLREGEKDIRKYVCGLEEVMIATVAEYGIKATREAGKRGIWVGNEKLAAIGVRVARWTTMHGFALNVSTRLSDFNLIVPCGLVGCGVTSLEKLLGEAPPMAEVEDRLVAHMGAVLGREPYEAEFVQ